MYVVMKFLVVVCIFATQMVTASSLDALSLLQGAELVDERNDEKAASHMIVLGALEKVNHELEPEASRFITGKKSSRTYYLPQARRTKQVADHYSGEFAAVATLVFTCVGRTCGSSSYWANRVFNKAILYGPEQFQHYLAFELNDGSGYVAIYVGQRATRKIYVHFESVTNSSQESQVD